MNIYTLIRLYQRIESPRVKLAGLLALHLLRRRYLNMVFDPVLACNLRCRMCYFSDPEARQSLHGTFSEADIDAIARSLFHRVLRLQIGCGAEPTVYKRLPELVRKAREHGIPNISLTSNGQVLTRRKLEELAEAGLTELTLSAHGMSQPVYEDLMRGAHFERFTQLIDSLPSVKQAYPQLRIRVNYTMNEDNISDLRLMPQVFAQTPPDVIQLRPIQKIGHSDYDNFSMERLLAQYDDCIAPVVAFCQERGITCLYPERDNLAAIRESEEPSSHANEAVSLLPYFHLAPYETWKEKIDPYHETFEDYCRRTGRVGFMVRTLLGLQHRQQQAETTKALNYSIK